MERRHVTGASREGLTLPSGGHILGALGNDLRVPRDEVVRLAGTGDKTIQRFFNGESIETTSLEAIVGAWVEIALPLSLRAEARPWVLAALRRWDYIVGELRGLSFPISEPADLAWIPLRLVSLEIGLRL
ncbi:MAG: hypothetical protein JNJ59_11775, partial [Deltaproteobacteria bacterium]|nr:hypothetical protein [Deltaproteobacteria bacterium]